MPIVCYSHSAQEKSTLTVFNCVSSPRSRSRTHTALRIYEKRTYSYFHTTTYNNVLSFVLTHFIDILLRILLISSLTPPRCRCRRHHHCRRHHFQECLGIVLGAKTQLSLYFSVYIAFQCIPKYNNEELESFSWNMALCRERINKILVKFSINFSITHFWCFWISSSLLITRNVHVNNCLPTARVLKERYCKMILELKKKAQFTYTVRFEANFFASCRQQYP